MVATPIGNMQDISQRALETLNKADAVICEEFREASTLLKRIGISDKQLLQINEHNEEAATEEIVMLLLNGHSLALISDAGTPAFEDPGTILVQRCMELEIPVKAVPGASSLMAAISLSPLPLDEFFYAGFLPRKDDQRKAKFAFLKRLNTSIIILDTPYRLGKLMEEIKENFGPRKLVTLSVDLTQTSEMVLHGPVQEVIKKAANRKGEFILVIHFTRE
jgi:16S rRNA (cytidine1402-2'-O)-methyltransferase